jgi:hypothetical protein
MNKLQKILCVGATALSLGLNGCGNKDFYMNETEYEVKHEKAIVSSLEIYPKNQLMYIGDIYYSLDQNKKITNSNFHGNSFARVHMTLITKDTNIKFGVDMPLEGMNNAPEIKLNGLIDLTYTEKYDSLYHYVNGNKTLVNKKFDGYSIKQ